MDRNLFFDFKNSIQSNKYLMECARKCGDGVSRGFGLLRDEGVAGVGDYDDGDAVAERGFQHAGEFARGDGVVFGLQIEDTRRAASEPVVDWSSG